MWRCGMVRERGDGGLTAFGWGKVGCMGLTGYFWCRGGWLVLRRVLGRGMVHGGMEVFICRDANDAQAVRASTPLHENLDVT